MADLTIENIESGVVFFAKIVPGSSRSCVCGIFDGMLKVKISAPAEKRKANKCLLEFLSKQIGIRKSSISIRTGQTSPVKQIEVLGISADALRRKLNLNKQDAPS